MYYFLLHIEGIYIYCHKQKIYASTADNIILAEQELAECNYQLGKNNVNSPQLYQPVFCNQHWYFQFQSFVYKLSGNGFEKVIEIPSVINFYSFKLFSYDNKLFFSNQTSLFQIVGQDLLLVENTPITIYLQNNQRVIEYRYLTENITLYNRDTDVKITIPPDFNYISFCAGGLLMMQNAKGDQFRLFNFYDSKSWSFGSEMQHFSQLRVKKVMKLRNGWIPTDIYEQIGYEYFEKYLNEEVELKSGAACQFLLKFIPTNKLENIQLLKLKQCAATVQYNDEEVIVNNRKGSFGKVEEMINQISEIHTKQLKLEQYESMITTLQDKVIQLIDSQKNQWIHIKILYCIVAILIFGMLVLKVRK